MSKIVRSGVVIAAAFVALAAVGEAQAGLSMGAHKVNIAPRPADYGGTWETNYDACAGDPSHATDTKHIWPENPNCIYSGGFNLGTAPYGLGNNALTSFDEEYGLWVRTVAIANDAGQTAVLTIIDGAYYFGRFADTCDDCGFFDLAEDLGAELDIDPSAFLFASTHSHAAPDFIGGWGGVPDWYMTQVTDAFREAVRTAVQNLEPATIEGGEVLARQHNSERRSTYYSAEEATISWIRGISTADASVIATVGVYAGHPTGHSAGPEAHPDYLGAFEKEVEKAGGVGLYFMSGLGNMSKRGGESMGVALANLLPGPGQGTPIAGDEIKSRQVRWSQPVTNGALLALGASGGFDRQFDPIPGYIAVTSSGGVKPCVSAAPMSVDTGITVIKIGNLTVTGGPGELFSNITNTVKERAPWVALPISLANDGLGYIMQSREHDYLSGEGLGFIGGGFFEYEDAYAIDHCFGDKVLEEIVQAMDTL